MPAILSHRALLRAVQGLRGRRAVVLAYHGLGAPARGHDEHNLQVNPEEFRRQLELLLAAGFELTTVAEFVANIGPAGPQPGVAALSFDDGMEDNHSVLAPVLAEFGVSATIFVATGIIGAPNPYMPPEAGERMLTEAEIAALANAGNEIGAHSVTHPDLSAIGYGAALREMRESKETLERITGSPVRTFAYPFGRYSSESVRAAQAAGFDAALTCINRGNWNPFELRRTMITGVDSLGAFVFKLSGAYEPLIHGRAGTAARRLTAPIRHRFGTRRNGR